MWKIKFSIDEEMYSVFPLEVGRDKCISKNI